MNRYIDIDKIEYEDMLRPRGNGNYEECQIAYRDRIDDIPIADVRENVRGEWINAKYPFSKCSICNYYFNTANNETNFCPNCGADMREQTNARDDGCDDGQEMQMHDLVSRVAAIDAIMKKPAWHGSDGSYYHSSDIRQAFEFLSPAQPELIEQAAYIRGFEQGRTQGMIDAQSERKKGEWIDEHDPLTLKCSECGYRVMRYNNTNFCPNCGADMRDNSTDRGQDIAQEMEIY